MTLFHAVVKVEHDQAQVLQFDAEHVEAQKVKARTHHTKQHGNAVRTDHEFMSDVCDAMQGIPEVLVTGNKSTLADFRHYVEKHRAALMPHILGWETVDHPTEAQLVALARRYFLKVDNMGADPSLKG